MPYVQSLLTVRTARRGQGLSLVLLVTEVLVSSLGAEIDKYILSAALSLQQGAGTGA